VEESKEKTKPSEVRVWHSRDERTIPMQEVQKQRDKNRSYLSAWHLNSNRFVRLGTDLMERVSLVRGERFATETRREAYRFENMFDRPRHDIYLINTESGERQVILEEVWHFEGSSATGRYLLYFKDGHYRSYDTQQEKHACLTCDVPTSFVNEDFDIPVRKENPPWGFAGWLKEDRAVLLYDKFDIWSVAPDGSQAENLTKGARSEIVHRYLRLDPEEKFIDSENPIYVSQAGYWSKKSGYAQVILASGTTPPRTEQLIWMDKQLSRLTKAKDAHSYAYVIEAFDESPDYYAAGPQLREARRITNTNPFQEDYFWGRSELIDYRNGQGKRLQAVLTYPAEYRTGQRYPMIVYVYEQLSRQVHRYSVPSERRPYNAAVFSTQGYFVLRPDIVYANRDPGVSAVDCVSAAVKEALTNEAIDPSKVGLVGHSWGGYEASFIPTQTDIFAAAVAGAPLTNFFSFYGTFHWRPGMPESQHFETGQGRMEVPFWEDMDAYIRNSPAIFIDQLKTPMMLFFGDADGTVDWHQGVEFYNYARRAGKELVMLVYPGEDHGARKKENQIDYHRRILSWFGHYLKGEEAPAWISEGVTALERERQLKKAKKK
jgi:acetyl esterase/lipase